MPRHWPTIVEAGGALIAAAVVSRALPFRRYISLGARKLGRRGRSGGSEARIVAAIANRVPFRAVCLQQGLAVQWMLRRRGVDAVLHYGVRVATGEAPAAHVWVSVGGEVVSGAPQHLQYAEVARYPAAGA